MESLSDKLKSLGVALGSDHLLKTQPTRKQSRPIESVLDGSDDITPLGSTFYVHQDYPATHQQGLQSLKPVTPSEILLRYCKIDGELQTGLENCIFMDTETSGLSGGSGTFAFMIGLGFFTTNGFRLVQLFLRDPGQESALLASLARFTDGFEIVVTFNGKSFDLPLLRTRHILNTLESPFENMEHIDLLPVARKLWRQSLPSRALADLERDVLAFSRELDEVPGWEIPQIYFDYLRSDDASPLKGVFYHNAMDILSLAALLNHINRLMTVPHPTTDCSALELAAVGRIYEDLGMPDTALELFQSSLSKRPPTPYYEEYLLRRAELLKRSTRWDEALHHWLEACQAGDVAAMVEVAKYHEHHSKDFSEALKWTKIAIEKVNSGSPAMQRRSASIQDLQHRLERLQNKLARQHNK